MRKVMFLALLAASVAAPTAAMAQRGEGRQARQEARQDNRAERQQARQENRAQRQEARPQAQAQPDNRAARQQARQQTRQARQQQPTVAQQRQGRPAQNQPTRSGWLGNPNDARMEAHRERYERLDRENARRNGTQEQYRGLVQQQGSQRQARREDRRDNRQDWRNDRRDDRRDWRQDNRQDRRNWNRGWRNDNRYDWQRYRNTNRFVFRVQPYYAPYRGYGYSRFSIGNVLDRLLWGQNYWINDPWTYRLPPAPYGYQWVRYYNDVVLVDTYNGEIVDVIHDFFW